MINNSLTSIVNNRLDAILINSIILVKDFDRARIMRYFDRGNYIFDLRIYRNHIYQKSNIMFNLKLIR